MYDIHAHILPGVDDGAKTPEETLAMCRIASETGTCSILATPHRKDVTESSSVDHLRNLVVEMSQQNRANGVELTLALGMENHLDASLPEEINSGRALPINGTHYILVEMPFFGRPNYVEETLFRIQVEGLTPVLAHPERIEAFQRDPELLRRFIDRGMISQITAGSIIGYFGGEVQRFTHSLLRRNMAHVMASDTHYPRGDRSPRLNVGIETAARIVGRESAVEMVTDTPRAIVEGRPVSLGATRGPDERSRWWQIWRSR